MRIILLLMVSMFLLAFSEGEQKLLVEVSNPASVDVKCRTVEVSRAQALKRFGGLDGLVVEDVNGVQLPMQLTSDALLFQVALGAGEKASYTVRKGSPKTFAMRAYGRLVPERKDDWAWENDRIGFRVYGPALEATGEVSNGIDVWLKRTENLVINKWYKPGVDYHNDYGEGLDCYKVGRTLGAGAMAPLSDGELCLGRNFIRAELLDSGAVRTTVRLHYAPYKVGGAEVTETREISLDGGSQFNKMTVRFDTKDASKIDVAAGIIMRENGGRVYTTANSVAYCEPEAQPNGTTNLALIFPTKNQCDTISNHVVLKTTIKTNTPYTYYNGAGWSKNGFENDQAWQAEVLRQVEMIRNPLKIKIK